MLKEFRHSAKNDFEEKQANKGSVLTRQIVHSPFHQQGQDTARTLCELLLNVDNKLVVASQREIPGRDKAQFVTAYYVFKLYSRSDADTVYSSVYSIPAEDKKKVEAALRQRNLQGPVFW